MNEESAMAISIDDISKTFGGLISKKIRALDGVSFSLERGEVCGLVGPNGAGKSTLISIIMGAEARDQGKVTVKSDKPVGFVPDRPMFYEDLTAMENLMFFAQYNKVDAPMESCTKLLTEFGLGGRGDEPVRNYSKGMKQRLAIARALLHGPDILVMDEPFTGLDPTMVIELRDSIKRLKGSGLTILLSSHDLHEVNNICDSVVFIKAGKVVNKESVAECHRTMDVQFTILNPTPSILSCLDGYAVIDRSGDGHTIVVKMERDEVQARLSELVKAGGLVQEVRLLERSVEDLYSELIMEDGR